MNTEVRIATGSISRDYLKKVSRVKFDKDFEHISEAERNDAWNQTHEPSPVQVKNPSHTIKLDPVV